MREARDVFPEVGYEERKLGVLKVLILFNDFSLIFFGYIKSKMFLIVFFSQRCFICFCLFTNPRKLSVTRTCNEWPLTYETEHKSFRL